MSNDLNRFEDNALAPIKLSQNGDLAEAITFLPALPPPDPMRPACSQGNHDGRTVGT